MSAERPGASPAASRLGRLLGWKPGALARNTALATFWQGVRLALSSEINKGDHWDEARINEVTGDGTLSARFINGNFSAKS